MGSDPKRNQVRRVVIGYEFVTDLLHPQTRVVNGLPEDAEFVRAYPMQDRQTIELVFRSEKFSPVKENEQIPEYDIVFENIARFGTKSGYQ